MAHALEAEGQIYQLASDCEALFVSLATKEDACVVRGLLLEYQQRFSTWTAYLGVFARPSQCLDGKLQRLPDIKDIVLRLLDSLGTSLTACESTVPDQPLSTKSTSPPESPATWPPFSSKDGAKHPNWRDFFKAHQLPDENPHIKPFGNAHQFSYQPTLGPEQLTPRSSSISPSSSSLIEDSSDINSSKSVSIRSVHDASTLDVAPEGGDESEDSKEAEVSHTTATLPCDFTLEDVDPMDSDCEGLDILHPTEIESSRSRSRSRHRELDKDVMHDVENLNYRHRTSENDSSDFEEEDFLRYREQARILRRRKTAGSFSKHTHSELSDLDDDCETLDVSQVRASAQRMRRKTKRAKLPFHDPPPAPIDEQEETGSGEVGASLPFRDPPPARINKPEEPNSDEDGCAVTESLIKEANDGPAAATRLEHVSLDYYRESLREIEETLDRLDRLGLTIRQSAGLGVDHEAKALPERRDPKPVDDSFPLSVQALYPKAHPSLRNFLSNSVSHRYTKMMLLKLNHQAFSPRPEQKRPQAARFPVRTPPKCPQCDRPGIRALTKPSNRNAFKKRPYFYCHSVHSQSVFIAWDDDLGVTDDNPYCRCTLPSRRTSSNGPAPSEWYSCATGRCRFREKVDECEAVELEGSQASTPPRPRLVTINKGTRTEVTPSVQRLDELNTPRGVESLQRNYGPSVTPSSSVDPPTVQREMHSDRFHGPNTCKASSVFIDRGGYPNPPAKKANQPSRCDWCAQPLSENDLDPKSWSQHVDQDLRPYLCLTEECAGSSFGFPSFDEWQTHMQQHGQFWHQHVFQLPTWICSICEHDQGAFEEPQELLEHMRHEHNDEFSDDQLQLISQHGRILKPRPRDECPLCMSRIDEVIQSEQTISFKRKMEQPHTVSNKRIRANNQVVPPHPDANSDDDKNGDPGLVKAMAQHIASHLRELMFLTIRVASAQPNEVTQ